MLVAKLIAGAGLLTMAAFAAPATAAEVVHRQTVTTHSEHRDVQTVAQHKVHRICKTKWRHHHRVRTCRTVRWTEEG